MIVLGLGGLLNEAAAAVLKDGVLVSAAEQRKVARHHGAGELPRDAVDACLKLADAAPDQVDCVALTRPFSRGPESALHLELRSRFPAARLVMVEHQTAHAASAYFPSGFDHATVLTLDRSGDFRCGGLWRAEGNHLHLERELYHPDSLGDFYSRVTQLLGFTRGADEHKVQWMSAAASDRLTGLFLSLLPLQDDWPRSDRSFFDGERVGHGGFSARFYHRLGIEDGAAIPPALREDIAGGVQRALEQTVIAMAGGGENLCLAGGVLLNALLVEALEHCGKWKNVYVQPAAGNAGTAIGAGFYAWHIVHGQPRNRGLANLFLGPSFTAEEIKRVLENCKLRFHYLLTTGELIDTAVRELNAHKIIAWMHGRMEFGPRALGNRSILASPADPYASENLNEYIKHREPFRKFAASVPAEVASEYFETGPNARFLATVGRVRPPHRRTFESALLDGDRIRVHTVEREQNELYWQLLHAAAQATGLPVLYNTSFNLFGDPLVCAPRDAVRSFFSSGIDSMFVGHFHLEK